jgi:hypothetical protein
MRICGANGREGESGAGDGEQGRIGYSQPFRQIGEDDSGEQQHQDPFEQQHGAHDNHARVLQRSEIETGSAFEKKTPAIMPDWGGIH